MCRCIAVRRYWQGVFFALSTVVSFAAASPLPNRPADISVSAFFRPAAFSSPKLNPAGTRVAMLISDPKVDATGLIVQELATGKLGGFPADQTYDLYSFRWAGDDRIVFSVARDKMYAHGLYSILWDKPAKLATHNRYDALQVLGTPHARPSNLHVWIRQAARQEGAPGDLLEINLQRDLGRRLATRESVSNLVQAIAPPPGTSALRWLLDGENEVRYVIAHSAGNLRCYRREAKGHWVLLPLDIERNTPLGVEGDPNVILLARLNEHSTLR